MKSCAPPNPHSRSRPGARARPPGGLSGSRGGGRHLAPPQVSDADTHSGGALLFAEARPPVGAPGAGGEGDAGDGAGDSAGDSFERLRSRGFVLSHGDPLAGQVHRPAAPSPPGAARTYIPPPPPHPHNRRHGAVVTPPWRGEGEKPRAAPARSHPPFRPFGADSEPLCARSVRRQVVPAAEILRRMPARSCLSARARRGGAGTPPGPPPSSSSLSPEASGAPRAAAAADAAGAAGALGTPPRAEAEARARRIAFCEAAGEVRVPPGGLLARAGWGQTVGQRPGGSWGRRRRPASRGGPDGRVQLVRGRDETCPVSTGKDETCPVSTGQRKGARGSRRGTGAGLHARQGAGCAARASRLSRRRVPCRSAPGPRCAPPHDLLRK